MTHNVGTIDRIVRATLGLACAGAALVSPWMLVPAVMLMFTALAGSCPGYRLLGRSTCHVK